MSDNPDQMLGFVLHDVARLLRWNFDRRANALGLSRAQWSVLAQLRREDGIQQKVLADLLDIQPITLVRLIDRLEKAGLVERRDDPDDRRAKKIFIAKKAMPVIDKLKVLGRATREEALAGISAKDEEQLMRTLLKIRTNLSERASHEKSGKAV
jgi:MarR family transcriptional regulator for hemolysin